MNNPEWYKLQDPTDFSNSLKLTREEQERIFSSIDYCLEFNHEEVAVIINKPVRLTSKRLREIADDLDLVNSQSNIGN